jgi:hypothetical protein
VPPALADARRVVFGNGGNVGLQVGIRHPLHAPRSAAQSQKRNPMLSGTTIGPCDATGFSSLT